MTIWRAGMKCVLVDDNWNCRHSYNYANKYPVLLYQGGWGERAFGARRFRPVTERKSENKHFATLRDLLTNPNKVLEDA